MNIPFTLADSKLDGEFLEGAEARGMMQLKGHRAVGGMRASIYNAMPIEACASSSNTCGSSKRSGVDSRTCPIPRAFLAQTNPAALPNYQVSS
jgi:hypothetical protein